MKWRLFFLLTLAVPLGMACSPEPPDLSATLYTDDLSFRILPDPVPPRARETVKYKVVVRDSKTGQPIEGGQGRIFATSADRANYWDALLPGEQLGTYYANMQFITSGQWAIAIQFRRDSTKALERVDWMQEVAPSTSDKAP